MSASDSPARESRRVKIFTVHGTFAKEAAWDNWDAGDDPTKPSGERNFVNRLSDYLRQHGVQLDQADHSEFNWSGGNSHDDRRVAALALKKAVQDKLREIEARVGMSYKEYYDGGVYIIGHSHGGTLSRLAMKLWDQDDPFYKPELFGVDELAHRNGASVPNEIDRPDGVVTFGSPFVHFTKRERPLLVAQLFARAMIFIGVIVVAVGTLIALGRSFGNTDAATGIVDQVLNFFAREPFASVMAFLWPLFLCWLFAFYIPNRILSRDEAPQADSGYRLLVAKGLVGLIKTGGVIALVIYYVDFYLGGATGLWQGAMGWLGSGPIRVFWLAFPFVIYWLLALSLPRRALAMMKGRLEDLGNRLPQKYDPPESAESQVPFLSFHTPGDEAGLGLRIFGLLTWAMRTVWLAIAVALVTAFALLVVMLVAKMFFGADAMAALWNGIFAQPVRVWNAISGAGIPPVSSEQAGFIPIVLGLSMLVVVLFVLPITLLNVALIYLVGLWLRGTGIAFGGERLSWTMAADIGASPRPNTKAKMRRSVLVPEAWLKGEMAHCYFYKSDKVINDLAQHIADWPNAAQPTPASKIAAILPKLSRWIVALAAVLAVLIAANQSFSSITIG